MATAKKAAPAAAEYVPNNVLSICETRRSREMKILTHRWEQAREDFSRSCVGLSGQPRDPETTASMQATLLAMEGEVAALAALEGVALADKYLPGWRPVEAIPFGDAVNRGQSHFHGMLPPGFAAC